MSHLRLTLRHAVRRIGCDRPIEALWCRGSALNVQVLTAAFSEDVSETVENRCSTASASSKQNRNTSGGRIECRDDSAFDDWPFWNHYCPLTRRSMMLRWSPRTSALAKNLDDMEGHACCQFETRQTGRKCFAKTFLTSAIVWFRDPETAQATRRVLVSSVVWIVRDMASDNIAVIGAQWGDEGKGKIVICSHPPSRSSRGTRADTTRGTPCS